MTAAMSVIIPAHDEATVIGPHLQHMSAGVPEGGIEFIVVANGCRDDTAARARAALPRATVLEISEQSKIAALNAGDAAATHAARAYIDADVRIAGNTLLALATFLDTPLPRVAAPLFQVNTRGSSIFVRAHYKVWEQSEYRRTGHIGSGVYALSPSGRARFTDFPAVIADDRYVQQLFTLEERSVLTDHSFEVAAPRTLRAQIRRATRVHRGNAQIARAYPEMRPGAPLSRHGSLLARVALRPSLWPAFPVYVIGTWGPRLRAGMRLSRGWERDETRRQ